MKFAHLINPVAVKPDSDLGIAQPVTFASMVAAKEYAKSICEVDLLATCYEEDAAIMPAEFRKTALLDRSILDLGKFEIKRKLPILADLLSKLYETSDADYLIYTNVDIALMPNFYSSVSRIIQLEKSDALVINRRTISKSFSQPDELPLMYSQVGDSHVGYDCFIFTRELFHKLNLGKVCVGVSLVGLVFMLNLYRYAKQFNLIEDAHLTFHMGDDQTWKNPKLNDYLRHNENEAKKIIDQLEADFGLFDASSPSWSYNAISELKGRARKPHKSLKSKLLNKTKSIFK